MPLIHFDDLKNMPPRTVAEEQEYRRGYADGWIDAMNAFMDLMQTQQLSKEVAYEALYDHWQALDCEWREQGGTFVLPPSFSARQVAKEIRETQERQRIVGVVYLLRADNGYHKIGRTKNLKRRLTDIGIKVPVKIELIHKIESNDIVSAERFLHDRFGAKRVNGEWFSLTEDDVAWLKNVKSIMYDEPASLPKTTHPT